MRTSSYLSACDCVPELKLCGDEFVEQKLSIDTESLPPVFDFLMNATGEDGGDSLKFISWTSLLCTGNAVGLTADVTGGAGSFGGGSRTSMLFEFFISPLFDFFAPNKFEKIFMGSL